MKLSSKLALLQASTHKPSSRSSHFPSQCTCMTTAFMLLLIMALSLSFITKRSKDNIGTSHESDTSNITASPLLKPIFNALLHYAAANSSSSTGQMSFAELSIISSAINQCDDPCNLLVFGITHETLLWHSLNHKGVTIFIDESSYLILKLEKKHSNIEAYDVKFTTKVDDLYHLIAHYREQLKSECRPVQNLLFSDCRLAINDMPNHVYDIPWDIILVHRPRRVFPAALGRISTIYTAGVLARSKNGGAKRTHVFVHKANRKFERDCMNAFMCSENLVENEDSLAHFVVEKLEADVFEFCPKSQSLQFQESITSPNGRRS